MNSPRPMGESARAALSAYAETEAPPAGAKAAGWDALQSRIAAGDPGPSLGAGGTEAVPVAAAKSPWLLAGVGLVAAGGIAAAVLGLSGADAPDGTRGAPEVAAVASDTEEAPTDEKIAPAPAPEEEAPEPVEPTVSDAPAAPIAAPSPKTKSESRRSASKPTTSKDAPKDGPNLGPEVALMGEARQALGRGDAARAVELFDRHAKLFPNGVFAKERQVSRITALCALGKTHKARRAADRFLARYPKSALASRVRNSCGAPSGD